jgi:hypothetical protein
MVAMRAVVYLAPEIVHDWMTPASMRAQYPRALRAIEAHPWIVGVIFAAVLVTVIVVVTVDVFVSGV